MMSKVTVETRMVHVWITAKNITKVFTNSDPYSSVRREKEPYAIGASSRDNKRGEQFETSREVVEGMMEDIQNTFESIHSRTEQDSTGGQQFILPINAEEMRGGKSHLRRSFSFQSETPISQLKEAMVEAVETTVEKALKPVIIGQNRIIIGQNRVMEMCEIIRTQGDESRAVLDFVKDMTKALRADEFDTPRLACLLSPWHFENLQGLSPAEQDPKWWTRKVQHDSASEKGWFSEKKRLFLVCAKSLRLVPSGRDGHGYQITEIHDWVKRTCGVIRVMVELTSVILGVGSAGGLVSNLVQAVGKASEIAKNEDFWGLKERYTALTNDGNYRRIEQRQVAFPGNLVTSLQRKAYEALKEFVRDQEDEAFAEMVKAVRKARRSGRDPPDTSRFVFFEDVMEKDQEEVDSGEVHWVLKLGDRTEEQRYVSRSPRQSWARVIRR